MALNEPPLEVQMQYRALVECRDDPCRACRGPRRREAQNHPAGPFDTSEGAHEHGRGMARNVYGADSHRVLVEARPVGPWTVIDLPDPRR